MKALGPILLFWLPAPGGLRHHRRHRLLRTVRDRLRHGREHPLPRRERLRLRRGGVRPGRRRARPWSPSSWCASCSPASRTRCSPSMTGIGLGIAARVPRPRSGGSPRSPDCCSRCCCTAPGTSCRRSASAKQPLILLYGYFAVMMPIFLGDGRLRDVAAVQRGPAHRADAARVRPGRLVLPAGGGRAGHPRPAAVRPPWARRVAGDAGAKAMPASSSPRPSSPCCATACTVASTTRRPAGWRRSPRSGTCSPRSPRTARSSSAGTRRRRPRCGTAAATT